MVINMENSIYFYESQILEQKLNYFILESRYYEMILNESIGDKLKSAKKFIIDRFKDLIGLFISLKEKIGKFFKEVVLKKIKQIKEKIFKNKSKKDGKLETIDIEMLLKDLDNVDKEYGNIIDSDPSLVAELDFDVTKSVEELNNVINKFQQYKVPTLDEIKKKLNLHSLEEIDKTKIKITVKEIENIFKQSEKNLVKEDLNDIDQHISDIKGFYKEIENTNEGMLSDEKMALLIKYHKVYISHETSLCTILNSILTLHNQYVSKALSYFDTYLKDDNSEVSDEDMKSLSNDFKEAVDTGKTRRVHIMLADSMLLDPTFRDLNTELKYASKMKGLFDEHDGGEFEEDPNKWNDDYMDKIMVELKMNFSRERLEHAKKVVRKLIPVNGKDNQKKTITDKDDFKNSMTYAGKDLKKAIDDKNYMWIRGTMMNSMWNDPTFEHGEFDKLVSICKKYMPKIFEQEKKVPSEEHFEQSKWTKEYFVDLTYYFRENPALSRIPYIKKVGKYVYGKDNQKKNDN